MSAIGLLAWRAQRVDDGQPQFHITYTEPGGFKYEVTGKATSQVVAVRLADKTLEYVERIGSHHIRDDGTTADPSAQLQVELIQPMRRHQVSAS